MRLFNRKSKFDRLLDTVNDSLDTLTGLAAASGVGSGMALKDAVRKDKARKAGLIAGGVAGLTAGSAGISSLRRRLEGARDDS
jgi:ammonia channel protein AmtB